MKRWGFAVLIAVFGLLFLVSVLFLACYFLEARTQQVKYDDLAHMVEQKQTEVTENPADESHEEPTHVWVTDPDTGERVSVLPEYAELYVRNNHLVGWLCIEDTNINYPVVQTPKEANYYLKRNFDRQDSNHGCLYVQENCDVTTPSDNIIIYGHNMRDGSMFAALHDYKRQSFWRAHPHIIFNTLTEYHTYEILSVFYTTASNDQGFAYHEFTDAADQAAFDSFVNVCKAISIYDTGVDASYGDKLITLSTCEYSQANGRFVVVAKRLSS